MGHIHAQITLENSFTKRRIETPALVDTGCLYLAIPERIANELGFDPTEFSTLTVWLADGTQRDVPLVGPIRIHYAGRSANLDALVFGDQPLMGALALEALNLSLNPATQTITVNLATKAMGFRSGISGDEARDNYPDSESDRDSDVESGTHVKPSRVG